MAHALLGPSSASRWMACPPSVNLTKDMPDTTSEYAAEGSLAHEIAELKLKKKSWIRECPPGSLMPK
ncbi:Protein of uncharacterised function (DUF2800) [Fusobacterium necrophorum subsp. necrophorum]|nr:Protein of uncharacterised function (DUF2800) [Fusobacterium necrophorum subsp. necrophorum]